MLPHRRHDEIADVTNFLFGLSNRSEQPEFRRAAVAVAGAECPFLPGAGLLCPCAGRFVSEAPCLHDFDGFRQQRCRCPRYQGATIWVGKPTNRQSSNALQVHTFVMLLWILCFAFSRIVFEVPWHIDKDRPVFTRFKAHEWPAGQTFSCHPQDVM